MEILQAEVEKKNRMLLEVKKHLREAAEREKQLKTISHDSQVGVMCVYVSGGSYIVNLMMVDDVTTAWCRYLQTPSASIKPLDCLLIRMR